MQTSQQAKALRILGCVIVSNAHTHELKQMTQAAVDRCKQAGVNTVTVVVEKTKSEYYGAYTIDQPIVFNYNGCLNEGANYLMKYYPEITHIAFLNNDISPYPMWGVNLIEQMELNGYDSGSPKCSFRHPRLNGEQSGWQVGHRFCGWAFVLTKKAYLDLGKLDETFAYWCSDNIVAYHLEKKGYKHLITSKSVVNHLGNKSGKYLTKEQLIDYTWKEAIKFKELTGIDLFPPDMIKQRMQE